MARVKLSEYRAKSLFVSDYQGISLRLNSLDEDIAKLSDDQTYIIKVDQGVKKRGKQGLIKLNVTKTSAKEAVNELSEKGFQRFIAEPMIPHEDTEERYASFERTRDGIAINYSEMGGVDIEDHPDSVKRYTAKDVPLDKSFVNHVVEVMNQQHISFVEINPLLIREKPILLDAAVLADSAGEYQATWTEDDVVEARNLSESEAAIAELNDNSPAAFSFRVLNKNGAIWLLLSGGGASITIADESANQHKAEYIGDYGEYSGGPSTEETYLYTNEVLRQVLKSEAPKIALIIAGGVANFTDVKKTFRGVIQALTENLEALRGKNVKVFVRRGGPNEKEGLELMKKFLENNKLFGSVHGSDIVLTDVINEALEYIDA